MTVLVLLALLFGQGNEIKWQEAYSLSCVQLKVQGRSKSNVPFTVYKAADRVAHCCDPGAVVYRSRTKRFGYFDVPTVLEVHRNYYLVFVYKGSQLTAPIEMRNNYQAKDCEQRDHIINFDKSGRPELKMFVNVKTNHAPTR